MIVLNPCLLLLQYGAKGAESTVGIFNLDSTSGPLSEVPRIALDRTTISAMISGLRIWSSSQCAHKCGNVRAKHRVSVQTEERRRKCIQLCGLCGELWHSTRFHWEEEGPATSHCDFWQMSKSPILCHMPECPIFLTSMITSPPVSELWHIHLCSLISHSSVFPKTQQMSDGG